MKTLFSILFSIIFLCSGAAQVPKEGINWISINEALALQKKNPKKIIMDVYTNWCGPCKLLDKNTFSNYDVINYINTHYYAVKFNAEGNEEVTYNDKVFQNPGYNPQKANRRNSTHQFSRSLRVNAYPTIVFFDESGNVIAPIRGYQSTQQLELYLKLFNSGKYKEMTSQDKFNAYYKAFKPQFRNNSDIINSNQKNSTTKIVATEETIAKAKKKESSKKDTLNSNTNNNKKFVKYTVIDGDTLGKIALQFYNNRQMYKAIFEANKDVLKNKNSIYPGQVLKIPEM